jgi:hypothetical protein
MDTEEQVELKKAMRDGRPETDEGPYYHESWWESYKGGVKGKLGGLIIGTALGAVVGTAAAAVVATLGGVTLGLGGLAAMVGGFSAAGLIYGAHEFSEVGKVTGAVAAAHEKAEQRMKEFESGKFAEIKQEIGEIKAMVAGQVKPGATVTTAAQPAGNPVNSSEVPAPGEPLINYRTQHCDEHCPPEKRKYVFWKVAAIGLLIGATAGAVLGIGAPEIVNGIIHSLGLASAPLSGTSIFAASVAALGAFGASFGINRDMFRQVFDKTDLWFKGITRTSIRPVPQPEPSVQPEKPVEHKVATAVLLDSPLDYPQSQTFHRDRVLAAAEKSLLSFDHTRATPH